MNNIDQRGFFKVMPVCTVKTRTEFCLGDAPRLNSGVFPEYFSRDADLPRLNFCYDLLQG